MSKVGVRTEPAPRPSHSVSFAPPAAATTKANTSATIGRGGHAGRKASNEESGGEEEEAEEADAEQVEAMEDQFEAALAARGAQTWSMGGVQKDIVIRVLIQCFASMIESSPRDDAVPDFYGRYKPEDMVHSKLLDASRQVVKAKKTLLKHENFDTRDFTIFIMQKQWVPNILRPLLELCAKDDSNLATNCAGLALVLVRRMSDKALQLLHDHRSSKKSSTAKRQLLSSVTPSAPSGDDEKKKSIVLSDSEGEDGEGRKGLRDNDKLMNARNQLSALLSFKAALCSEKCNEAITNAFREYWTAEQVMTSEDTKLGVAICLSYFRRILAIGPDSSWSTPGEILQHKDVHHQYIVQLREILSVVPGICSDLRRSYHDDWLADVIHIIYFVLQAYDAMDMFLVWKENGIIAEFASLLTEEDDAEPAVPAKTSVQVPAALQQKHSQKALSSGLLSSKLQAERSARSQAAAVGQQRFSRFTATYRQPLHMAIASSGSSALDFPLSTSDASVASTGGGDQLRAEGMHNPMMSAGAAPSAIPKELSGAPSGADKQAAEGSTRTTAFLSDAMFVRDVFTHHGEFIPQAKTKRNQRKKTFVQDNPYLTSAHAIGLSKVAQQATVVAASFLEVFSQEACFKTFVRRVNEDLRRDERRISHDLELEYLAIVCKVMQYNRFKLQHSLEQATSSTDSSHASWQPSFKNIIDALDKMSLTRVTVAIEKFYLSKKVTNVRTLSTTTLLLHRVAVNSLMIVPISLLTEMIAYLRLMLLTDNITYHEIAIAALHRLYYTTQTNKLDVLPKLWGAFKNNTYTKEYLVALIFLSHETCKVLDTARSLFNSSSTLGQRYQKVVDGLSQANKKTQQSLSKRELDLEVYIWACYRFSPVEYFRKLVNPQTCFLYLKVLQDLQQNSSAVNHYISVFLQRCLDYRVESATGEKSPVNLAYLFFNIRTLVLLEGLLNHPAATKDSPYANVGSLLRTIVSNFAATAQRNHLLYAELVQNNLTNLDQCLAMHTVYDAHLEQTQITPPRHDKPKAVPSTGTTVASEDTRGREDIWAGKESIMDSSSSSEDESNDSSSESGGEAHSEDPNRARRASREGQRKEGSHGRNGDEEEGFGDEFDLGVPLPELFTHHPKIAEAKAKPSRKRKSPAISRKGEEDNDDDDEEDGPAGDQNDSYDNDVRRPQRPQRARKSRADEEVEGRDSQESDGEPEQENDDDSAFFSKPVRKTRRPAHRWSAAEDDKLRELYALYASSRSYLSSIAEHDDMLTFGTNRTTQQVAHRIKALGLRNGAQGPFSASAPMDRRVQSSPTQPIGVEETAPGSLANEERSESRSPAAWETSNVEEEDIFEKRSLALQRLSQNMDQQSGDAAGNGADDGGEAWSAPKLSGGLAKKTFGRKRARGLQRKAASASESADAALASDSEGSATMMTEESKRASAPSRALHRMLESDDEES